MRTSLTSVHQYDGLESAELAVRGLEDQWRRGEPDLEKFWAELDCDKTVSVLAALVKVDLRCRYERGGRPTVAQYFERYPELCEHNDRVISLVYEEFCLCEEQGERPDPEQFCDRYEPWRDSLASQLRYHRDFSQVVGTPLPSTQFPVEGDCFEQFQLRSLLGQGGSARVFRALDDSMGGREVVLKVSADRGNEPSILGKLDHIHIVPVLRVAMQPERGLRGLSMPYRPGLPLDEIIKKLDPASSPRGALAIWDALASADSPEQKPSTSQPGWQSFPIRGTYEEGVAWIVATLAEALAYSHHKGIFHRDVKPANVLLTRSNGPQLLDFNLAYEPHSADQARAALRGGTLPYMAPEQLDAYIDPDHWDTVGAAAEIYSLGLLMHELLTGQPPEVPDQNLPPPRAIRALLDRRVEPRVSPRHLNAAVPHALEGIVSRCLMYKPEDRYPDAGALADDLHRFLERRPLRYALNASASERFNNYIRRNWDRLALSVALLIAIAMLLKPYAMRQFPIEQRSAFQEAVHRVDTKPKTAVKLLDSLVLEYPDSALGFLYLGLAQERAGDDPVSSYVKAIGMPKAEAEFLAWRKTEPNIARRLVAVGKYLTGRQLEHEVPYRAFRIAVALNRNLGEAHRFIAKEQSRLGQHALAIERLTGIITIAESRLALADKIDLLDWYEQRSMAYLSWGDSSRSRVRPDISGVSKKLYQDALDDLQRGIDLLNGDGKGLGNREVYLVTKAKVETALGDRETDLTQSSVASRHYIKARNILEELSPDIKQTNEIVVLRREIEERLKALASRE